MIEPSDRPRHSLSVAIGLTVIVAAIATAVAYLGTREGSLAQAPLPAATEATVRLWRR